MSLEFIAFSELSNNRPLVYGSFFDEGVLQSFQSFSIYYKRYFLDQYCDLSFAIFLNHQCVGYTLCSRLNTVLTTPDGGVDIVLNKSFTEKEQKHIYKQTLDYLMNKAQAYTCSSIIIKDASLKASLSILGEILFNRCFESRLTFEMNIPFSNFSETDFHASLRKSYKSLLSWGKKELEITCINKEHLDQKRFSSFQEFHKKISKKVTRSQETWDGQYQMIQGGFGELILATYKGELAAGSLFADYGKTSLYFTGVYERDLFDFGISHFLLYDGILSAYKRHQTSRFSLGYFDTDIKDQKWYNVQFFKKGFCKELTPIIFWSKEIKI